MLRSGPANDTANPATEQTTATAITAVDRDLAVANSQPTIAAACCAQYADREPNTAEARPVLSGVFAVEKAQQTSVQRGERQVSQNLADQNGRVKLGAGIAVASG